MQTIFPVELELMNGSCRMPSFLHGKYFKQGIPFLKLFISSKCLIFNMTNEFRKVLQQNSCNDTDNDTCTPVIYHFNILGIADLFS